MPSRIRQKLFNHLEAGWRTLDMCLEPCSWSWLVWLIRAQAAYKRGWANPKLSSIWWVAGKVPRPSRHLHNNPLEWPSSDHRIQKWVRKPEASGDCEIYRANRDADTGSDAIGLSEYWYWPRQAADNKAKDYQWSWLQLLGDPNINIPVCFRKIVWATTRRDLSNQSKTIENNNEMILLLKFIENIYKNGD